jgi:hypothetical protein
MIKAVVGGRGQLDNSPPWKQKQKQKQKQRRAFQTLARRAGLSLVVSPALCHRYRDRYTFYRSTCLQQIL